MIQMCGIYVTQPTVRTIVQFGETSFTVACQALSDIPAFVKLIKEGNSALADKPDFQLFIEVLRNQQQRRVLLPMLDDFFELCFPDFTVEFGKHSINFKQGEKGEVVGQVNRGNCHLFSQTIKEVFLPPTEKDPELNIDESNAAARRLKEKVLRNRERLKKASEPHSNVSIYAFYISTLSIGMNIPVDTLYSYTPFQLYDCFRRFTLKQQYDQWFALTTVPFADTSKMESPKSWISDMYSDDNFVKTNTNTFSKFNQATGGR